MKQLFKSSFVFSFFGAGIVSICSTVCLLLLLSRLRSSWSAWLVMTQSLLLQDWELLPVKSLKCGFVLARAQAEETLPNYCFMSLIFLCCVSISIPVPMQRQSHSLCVGLPISVFLNIEVCTEWVEKSLLRSAVVLVDEGGGGGEVLILQFSRCWKSSDNSFLPSL